MSKKSFVVNDPYVNAVIFETLIVIKNSKLINNTLVGSMLDDFIEEAISLE